MPSFTVRCRRAIPKLLAYLDEDTDGVFIRGKLNHQHPMIRRLSATERGDMERLLLYLVSRDAPPEKNPVPIEITNDPEPPVPPLDVPDLHKRRPKDASA